MSNDYTPSTLSMLFLGKEVRFTVDNEGTMWWVAQDIAAILGIEKVRNSLANFPDDEKGAHATGTNRGERTMLTVNEPGLYRLIFQSRKQEAEAMKRWVFHDVLPTLRRFGSYTIPVPGMGMNRILDDPKGIHTVHAIAPAPVSQESLFVIPKDTGMSEGRDDEDSRIDITANLIRVWIALQHSTEWLNVRETARRAKTVTYTTGRILRRLTNKGLLDVKRAHSFWYKIDPDGARRNPEFYQEVKEMQGIFERQGIIFAYERDWNPNDFR